LITRCGDRRHHWQPAFSHRTAALGTPLTPGGVTKVVPGVLPAA